jgi:hypothetical protein
MENLVDVVEEYMTSVVVRKIWMLTNCVTDAEGLRTMFAGRDYTVSASPSASTGFIDGFENTLVTDWDTYAADQSSFRAILPSLDIVVLDGISELNARSLHKWIENASSAGWPLSPHTIFITA